MHVLDDGIQDEWEMPWVWDIYPLVGPTEHDRMLRPVQIFGIDDHVVLGDRHDLPSSEFLLAFALRGGIPPKDYGDGLVGILESESCILSVLLPLSVI